MKATMETWRSFRRLSGYARGVALEAAGALIATSIALRLIGFKRWKALLARFAPPPPVHAIGSGDVNTALDSAREIVRLQESAARQIILHTNCLEQSLVLWWLLIRRGLVADLRFGARKDGDRFEAHAWVESRGIALNNAGEEHLHFVPFEDSAVAMETQTP